MKVLVTGAAGFIGFHTTKTLISRGHQVLGFDNLNDYYDPNLKRARLAMIDNPKSFSFVQGDVADAQAVKSAWDQFQPTHVIHLAAQAGVRYSIENPMAYIHSNIVGFQNVIELARHRKPENFVYASSSSVYGGNKTLPFSEDQDVSHPISLYAATKLENELVAKTYSHLYEIPTSGLRFFTVYGPYGRPDMAMFKFSELMLQKKPIQVYHGGKMIRDFTYVDDIVSGILGALGKPEKGEVYNLGKGHPDQLTDMIALLEQHLGVKATREMLPIQAGDVEATLADISKAKVAFGYDPKTSLAQGVAKFCEWYRGYRKL